VNPSSDTTAPEVPTGLQVLSASPVGIQLSWNAIAGDPSLYGYEVLRSSTAGGPYEMIARLTANSYTDTVVVEGATYYYVVRALDQSFNRSGNSQEVSATTRLRTVTVVFHVTVPATTDATGLTVHIAGTLSRFDGGLPDWDPGAVTLTRLDATHWTITLTGAESTQVEYKYTLGDWDHVEKGASCEELGNRLNWRNVAPCGN
jgi:hypothetical protein